MKETIVQIDGMACSMCESHICGCIRNAFPVKKVTASHRKGQAVILSENSIPRDTLRDTIEKTGYTVLSVTEGEPKKRFGFHLK